MPDYRQGLKLGLKLELCRGSADWFYDLHLPKGPKQQSNCVDFEFNLGLIKMPKGPKLK